MLTRVVSVSRPNYTPGHDVIALNEPFSDVITALNRYDRTFTGRDFTHVVMSSLCTGEGVVS